MRGTQARAQMLGTPVFESRHPRAKASPLSLEVALLRASKDARPGCFRALLLRCREYGPSPLRDAASRLLRVTGIVRRDYDSRRGNSISVPLMVAISVSIPSCTA